MSELLVWGNSILFRDRLLLKLDNRKGKLEKMEN